MASIPCRCQASTKTRNTKWAEQRANDQALAANRGQGFLFLPDADKGTSNNVSFDQVHDRIESASQVAFDDSVG